jgi:hypothetical protein
MVLEYKKLMKFQKGKFFLYFLHIKFWINFQNNFKVILIHSNWKYEQKDFILSIKYFKN